MLDLDALKAFVVFSESRNFTRAAEKLYISQPSLHVKIKKLGENLGITLYRRNGKEIYLTEQGEQLVRFGREMLEASARFTDSLKYGEVDRPIVLAAGEGTYLYLLGELIRDYQNNSKTLLRLMTSNSEQTLEALRSGRAHFGVGVFDVIPDDLTSTRLLSSSQVLVVPKNHSLAKRRLLKISDLNGCNLVLPPANRPHRQIIAKFLQSEGVTYQVSVEANGWELMLHFVKLGLGCAIVNGIVTIPKTLKAIPLKELPKTPYSLVHHPSIGSNKEHKRFKRHILDTFSRKIPGF